MLLNILLDVESSSLHIVDEETAKILEDFDGTNDNEIIEKYGELGNSPVDIALNMLKNEVKSFY